MPIGFLVGATTTNIIFYNVKDYGAVGNGSTDDSTAINAAISAAVTASGGIVYFPPGNYYHASDILISGNYIMLLGAGRSSILTTAASSNANGIKVNGNHIVIADLNINGNKLNTQQPGVGTQYIHLNAIYITGSDDVTITRCFIQNYYEGGILADSSTNIVISQNEIASGNDNGVFLRPSPGNVSCSYVTVVNNIVHNNGYSGIQGVRANYLTFAGNVCYSNGPSTAQGDGCGFEGCTYGVIANNICYANGIQGINVRHTQEGGPNIVSSHIVVSGNVCYNHVSTNGDAGGISISETDDIMVTGNVVYGNYYGVNLNDGATSLGLTHCKVANNNIRGNTANGVNIQATGTKDILVTENYIGDNGSDGLYTTAQVLILAGIFKGNTGEGIHFASTTQNASNSLVNQACIYDNTDNGILIDSGVANVEVRNCWANNIVGTNQGRFLYESSGGGPTRLSGNRILNQANQPYFFNNASSRYYDEQTSGIVTVTAATYTVNSNDEIILCNRSGAVTITVPNPSNQAGRTIIVKDISGTAGVNTITITPASGTIDGTANKTITIPYGAIQLTNNGTNWFTLAPQRNVVYYNFLDAGADPTGAVDATAAINNLLALAPTLGGGTVYGPPGNFTISSPLIIYSNTNLILDPGCTITMTAGSNTNMLKNAASIASRIVTDAVTTAGSTTITSATANFVAGDVGKAVGVLGAGPNYGLGSAPGSLYGTISTVNSSTSITLSSAATSTTSGSTLAVYPARDKNIIVSGGTWNHGNVDSINQTLNSMSHFFRRIDVLQLSSIKQISTGSNGIGGRYAFNIGDCTNVTADKLNFSTGGDGLHFVGPGQYISVKGLTGTTGDDMCAFTAVDGQSQAGSLLGDVYGSISDVLVEGIQANGSWTALKVTAGTGSNNVATSITRFKAKDINGSVVNNAINVADYCGSTTFSGEIENVSVIVGANQSLIKVAASLMQEITLRGFKWPSGQATPSNGVINLNNSPTSVLIKDLEFLYSGSTGGPIILCPASFVRHLTIDGFSAPSQPTGALDILRFTTTSTSVSLLRMSNIFKSGSAGSGNVISCTATNYNIKAELSDIVTWSGGVFAASADSTSTLYITGVNWQTGSSSSGATLFTLQSPAILYLSNIYHTTTASSAIIANDAAATPVRLYGNAITLSAGTLFSRSATQAISGTGFGVSADLSILTPTDQDIVQNTNGSLSCGTGLCIFHTGGTGNGWKNIYSGATY